MYVQAAPWQCCKRMIRKCTLVESHSLRWSDVSLRGDPATGNDWLFLKVGSSRGCQEEGEHPLQPRAVKLCKGCAKYRPWKAREPNSPFYLECNLRKKKKIMCRT